MPPSKHQRQLDWEAVWKSLNWDDERRLKDNERERLRQRARQYALPVAEPETLPEDARNLLTFDLGEERYGIDVMLVRGVRDSLKIVRVPGTPPFYRGVINVRGQIITVLDLRLFFGQVITDEVIVPDEVVIVQSGSLQLAVLAHQVNGLVNLPLSEIHAVEHLPYALGITRERVIVLNIARLFEDERLVVGGASE